MFTWHRLVVTGLLIGVALAAFPPLDVTNPGFDPYDSCPSGFAVIPGEKCNDLMATNNFIFEYTNSESTEVYLNVYVTTFFNGMLYITDDLSGTTNNYFCSVNEPSVVTSVTNFVVVQGQTVYVVVGPYAPAPAPINPCGQFFVDATVVPLLGTDEETPEAVCRRANRSYKNITGE